jgi:hypothetical protein
MPQLENLSISFNLLFPYPNMETGLWLMQVTLVVHPCIRKSTFIGDNAYLEKCWPSSTPLFSKASTCFSHSELSLSNSVLVPMYNQESGISDGSSAIVSFSGTVTIYHPGSPQISCPLSRLFSDDDINQLHRQVATMVQISTAAMRVLCLMEDLSLESYGDCAIAVDFRTHSFGHLGL